MKPVLNKMYDYSTCMLKEQLIIMHCVSTRSRTTLLFQIAHHSRTSMNLIMRIFKLIPWTATRPCPFQDCTVSILGSIGACIGIPGGHSCSLAHFSRFRCPFRAAFVHVSQSHGHSCSLAHFSSSRCPFMAAFAHDLSSHEIPSFLRLIHYLKMSTQRYICQSRQYHTFIPPPSIK